MSDPGKLPKFVYRQEVKGHLYYRFRRPGLRAHRLPGIPGTELFNSAYAQLLNEAGEDAPAATAALRYALEESLPRARKRARDGGLPFDLTEAHIRELMEAQGFRCAVSKIPFHLSRSGRRQSASRLPFRPSIDRIEPNKGYVRGNVRILCFAVNMAIADWGDDVFYEICRTVARGTHA